MATSIAANPLATNLTPLVAGATAAASLANLALVIPQTNLDNPSATQGYQPLAALNDYELVDTAQELAEPLIFHYEAENNVTIESDITDHFVEDNTALQDQIALKPETVTVTGFIGELNNVLSAPLQILQTIANNLLLVNSYQPQLSITALEALNQAELLAQSAQSIANSAVSAWTSIVGTEGSEIGTTGSTSTGVFSVGALSVQNKQQVMFQQFYGYWANRTLFNVQTPWAIFTNMAIKSMRAVQDAESRMLSSFEVTFKKIRTASTTTTSQSNIAAGRAGAQSSPLTSGGSTAGAPGSSLGGNIAASQ